MSTFEHGRVMNAKSNDDAEMCGNACSQTLTIRSGSRPTVKLMVQTMLYRTRKESILMGICPWRRLVSKHSRLVELLWRLEACAASRASFQTRTYTHIYIYIYINTLIYLVRPPTFHFENDYISFDKKHFAILMCSEPLLRLDGEQLLF